MDNYGPKPIILQGAKMETIIYQENGILICDPEFVDVLRKDERIPSSPREEINDILLSEVFDG